MDSVAGPAPLTLLLSRVRGSTGYHSRRVARRLLIGPHVMRCARLSRSQCIEVDTQGEARKPTGIILRGDARTLSGPGRIRKELLRDFDQAKRQAIDIAHCEISRDPEFQFPVRKDVARDAWEPIRERLEQRDRQTFMT